MTRREPPPPGVAAERTAPGSRPAVALTVGKLDGLHAGHRHLLARVLAEADRRGVLAAALVLHPDPRQVLTAATVPLLTTVADRVARARAFGLHVVEPLQFTPDLAALEPASFLDLLSERYAIAALVVGPDFAFGRGRAGDLATLERLAAARGFELIVAEPLEARGEWVSSRRIRDLIASGDIAHARTLLRAPPRVVGTVVHGAARGRSLGFPTANLDPIGEFAVPANGIYAVRVAWKGPGGARRGEADGVASIGIRPTFDNGARLVEVHVLDYDGDLYGTDMAVDFFVRQRDELKFDDVGALVDQMQSDVDEARRHLAEERRAAQLWRDDAGRVRAAGRDLAEVAERLALGLASPDDDARPAPRHRCITVRGSSAVEVLGSWLAAIDHARDAEGQLAGASVYRAGPRELNAVVTSAKRRATTGTAPFRLVGLHESAGWLEATADTGC